MRRLTPRLTPGGELIYADSLAFALAIDNALPRRGRRDGDLARFADETVEDLFTPWCEE